MSLLPYQEPHMQKLRHALQNHKCVLDASETGTGKTYVTVALAMSLGLKPLIICPMAVVLTWKRVLNLFNCTYLGISNYESLKDCRWYPSRHQDPELGCKEECHVIKKVDKHTYEWLIPDDTFIVFDEAHRCKNRNTINASLLLSTKDIPNKVLLLSATIADRPKFFQVFSYVMNFITNLEEFRYFIKNYKDGEMNLFHKLIFPSHGARLRIKDLGSAFPKNQIMAESYQMDEKTAQDIQSQYDHIKTVATQAKDNEEASACRLSEIIYARQRIEALKVPTIIDLAQKHLDNGESVVIFVNFLDTMTLICTSMNIKCKIRGNQSIIERQSIIDKFNSNKENIIICQIQSGGVGISLHDIHGEHPRVAIISPSWSAQDMVQAFGRIHRAGGKTRCIQKLVYCHGTVEDLIRDTIEKKFRNYLTFAGDSPSPATPC